MHNDHVARVALELKLTTNQVQATMTLLDDGDTVPFIARYRKEVTGSLDEVAITHIRDQIGRLRELDKRRETVLKSLEDQGKLTDELKEKVAAADAMTVLEDIYLPYRPKRRTRGTMAKEKGLEPLAKELFEQGECNPEGEAQQFVDPEKEVTSTDEALAGARDIISEWVNEDAEVRSDLRDLFEKKATIRSKLVKNKETDGAKYRDYFDWEELLAEAPSHRILAMRRAADEGIVTLHVLPEGQEAVTIIERRVVTGKGPASEQVRMAVADSYKRLLSTSMETEMRVASKRRADEEAIRVFADNLRELLMASPLGQKGVLAIDPGYRTGCKVVCLDPQGKLLHNDTIYPLEPQKRVEEASAKVKELVERFHVEAIAIGNGTGGREAHSFCRGIDFGRKVSVVIVNESGASVYSASENAREEFPDQDVTVRGSVSIGRRLMDPLAELVKIEPKSVGVGQYQHDVDQKALSGALDDVVMSCVNAVGVEVNMASKQLLKYVSGLSDRLAGNIVSQRNEHGPFASRQQLLEIAGMGPKTFEQAAGFLRIRESDNPLDASAVHLESYSIVEAMAGDMSCTVEDLMQKPDLRERIDLAGYVNEKVGIPTLTDIMSELSKPGRDPREPFEIFMYDETVHEISDLEIGMRLPGVVTNVTAFGAFVDIGVHQDGLVHVSQLADRFVKNPSDVVKVHQKVIVTVIGIEPERNRIALSMRSNTDSAPAAKSPIVKADRPRKEPSGLRGTGKEGRPRKKQKQSRRHNAKPVVKPANNPFADFFKTWKPADD